jgi:2-iminobutanoate/2-iminopropanoate deaminase
MQKSFVRGTRPRQRAYSPAVITQGADKIIWLAGHGGDVEADGKSPAGAFEASVTRPYATSGSRADSASSSPMNEKRGAREQHQGR